MRFRKRAGLVVGAFTAGLLGLSGLVSVAHAAPSNVTVTQEMTCKFGSTPAYYYNAELTVTTDGTSVSATMTPMSSAIFPAQLKFFSTDATVKLTIDGEAVSLTGSTGNYASPISSPTDLPMPTVSATRTGTAPAANVVVGDIDVSVMAQFGSFGGPSANPIPCKPTQAVNVTATQLVSCKFGTTPAYWYEAELAVTTTGRNISATMSPMASTIFPAQLKFFSTDATVKAKVAGEAVTLTGSTGNYASPISSPTPLPMPTVTGTRTGADAATAVTIDDVDVSVMAQFGSFGGPSANAIPCEVSGPTAVTVVQPMTCQFGTTPAYAYEAELAVTTTGRNISATMSPMASGVFPAQLKFFSADATVKAKVAGEAVTLTGSTGNYASPISTPTALPMPTVTGTRTGADAATAVTIDDVDVSVMAQFGSFGGPSANPIPCGIPAGTTTALAAASPEAGKVTLTATLGDEAAAGKVDFFEGDNKVGTANVVDGVATLELTDVTAGSHAYTAVFAPTYGFDYEPSTSEEASVTVAAVGPTQQCTDAQAAQTKAQGAVNTATTALGKAQAAQKAAQAKVTKADKKVKKLKKAKKNKANKKKLKKAKAQLKAAKSQLTAASSQVTTATKQLNTAKTQLATAKNAVTANC